MTLSPKELTKLIDERVKTLARRAGNVCPSRDLVCEDLWASGVDVEARVVGERIFLLGINKQIPDPPEKFSQLVRD